MQQLRPSLQPPAAPPTCASAAPAATAAFVTAALAIATQRARYGACSRTSGSARGLRLAHAALKTSHSVELPVLTDVNGVQQVSELAEVHLLISFS